MRDDRPRVNVNGYIKAPYVRVTMDGETLGILPIKEALQRAWDAGLDLVEIAAAANPPVCQIMDYGKFKFEQGKKKKEQNKKNQEQAKKNKYKEVQVSPVIGENDLETKIRQVREFLEEGRPVQVTCIFARRQIMFKDQGFAVITKITEGVKDIGTPESAPRFNEKRLQIRFKPSKG